MDETYVVLHNGAFSAFWDMGPSKGVHVYSTSTGFENHFDIDWSIWDTVKHGMQDWENKLPDIVNLVSAFLQERLVKINKSEVKKSRNKPGIYFPRLWRGSIQPGPIMQFGAYNPINSRDYYGKSFVQSMISSVSMFNYLTELFRYVEPSEQNNSTYSSKMRELLILSCTEVEMSLRGFLDENGYKTNGKYNMRDYYKAGVELKLECWTVGLIDYPDMGVFQPFLGWNCNHPTRSLEWYDAYNGVKHNREKEFQKASLRNTLNAMAALIIILGAQWGPHICDGPMNRMSPFQFLSFPKQAAEDMYIPSHSAPFGFSPGKLFQQ